MRLHLDVAASVAATHRQNAEGAVKVAEDLDRYRVAIEATRPDVLIECGTWLGGSARWFAELVPRVISIDIGAVPGGFVEGVHLLTGDSVNPAVAARAAELAGDGRVMVVLDSEHNPVHVRREIELYGPLVSPGCYLVVEDGILRWMYPPDHTPGPLDAIEDLLDGRPGWTRDEQLEQLHPVTMYPAGWWVRDA